jgi:hypothetical protein
MRCRLKKLYRIAEWIVEDDLRSSDPGNDFVTESESGSAKAFDFFRKISNGYLDSIPSASFDDRPASGVFLNFPDH